MIVDQTKTGRENILKMVRAIANKIHYSDSELVFSNPIAQAPASSNGQNNSRLTITGLNPSIVPGMTTVNYNRLTLPTARPTAGNKIFINNNDTHATLLAKIVQQHRMVADQVVLTTQTRLPNGRGEALDFKVDPIANSLIYAPGTLTIKVINNDVFQSEPSSYFFGDAIDTRNGLPVHQIPSVAFVNFVKYLAPDIINFWRMLNHHQPYKSIFEITSKDGTVGALEIDSLNNNTFNTYVRVDPRDGSVFSNSFYVFYRRFTFGATRNMRNAGDKFRVPISNDYLRLVCEYEGIPLNSVTVSSLASTATSRTVVVQWLNGSYIGLGGGQLTTFQYSW